MSGLDVLLQRQVPGAAPVILDRDSRALPGRESAERLERCLRGLRRLPACSLVAAEVGDEVLDELIRATHPPGYVDFLAQASLALGPGQMRIDATHVAPGVSPDTPITAETYPMAREGVRTAVAAARRVAAGASHAYALCRPPGHHAGPTWMGGYCYLNNAVAAARALRAAGAGRVGIVDLDFHFGNGSAALAAELPDVFFASLHASTLEHYPYQATAPLGERQVLVAFERPPLAAEYVGHLCAALARAVAFRCEALVVSVGYDIIAGDPHGAWSLPASVFAQVGAALAERQLPLCLVQEGGYLLDALEECAFQLGAGLLAGSARRRA